MPGGVIAIEIDKEFYATMTGAVRKICEGVKMWILVFYSGSVSIFRSCAKNLF